MDRKHYYADEKNAQIALMEAHGIHKEIAKSGETKSEAVVRKLGRIMA